MQDFFDTGNSLEQTPMFLQSLFQSIYGYVPTTSAFLGLNLMWPKFDLPENYNRYFLSWHTEQFDVFWLKRQAERVYPRPILVASDGSIDHSIFPDNVEFVRWITWGQQLTQLVNRYGVCYNPQLPKYKISSLSFRVSQYKNYITAYLLQHANPDELLLTYHQQIGKDEDLHGYPVGIEWLDNLDIKNLTPTWINFKDNFDWKTNQPVDNGGWQFEPYTDALINFTNESFHYTLSSYNGENFIFPSPYITEKTWKPLLAGRPFLSIGQWHIYQALSELGLNFDYGFPVDYDNDPGDLTRIRDIFQSIDVILNTPREQLYEQSLSSVQHNVQLIEKGEFAQACWDKNEQALGRIQDFLSV